MENTQKFELSLPFVKSGKVREIYSLDEHLLIISTDRISAFDFILPSLIPDKGKVLNQISIFWFNLTRDLVPNHIYCSEPENLTVLQPYIQQIRKRSVLVKKLKPLPVEAIVRGYLVGSGWVSYQKEQKICSIELPAGLKFAQKLPEPLFTPTTKAEIGHDENISFSQLENLIGSELAHKVRDLSLKIYDFGQRYAEKRGIILADCKFEFGLDDNGEIFLIDELFTPDSSRFWKVEEYSLEKEPPSYDKQFVRNFLLNSDWDCKSPPPPLPEEIINKTRDKYFEIFKLLTGREIEI